jgi:ADP-heptose:LPS heptosyltransferase
MKVLVIRFSSIGDIVLTTPVLRCLKQQKPGVSIHYLTKAAFRSVVSDNPYIDKLHYLEDNLGAIIEELKKEQFDCVIDLHNNWRSMRVKNGLDVKSHTFRKLNFKKWLLVNLKINLMPDASIVERYMETVEELGVSNDGRGLDHFIPEHAILQNTDIPMSHWAGYVGCVIGGSYNTKKFPVAKWIEFCEKLPYPIILLGGPEDRDDGQMISEINPVKIYNACGKFNLNESAYLVKKARVIVTNDTGLMHFAAAFKKNIVSLWGNTSPEMGMYPYYGYNNVKKNISPNSIIMENKNLYCHPCSKIGYDKCPKGHFKCMNLLDVNDLLNYVVGFWKDAQPL